jgi:uncharacterized protein (DUF2147 family)
MLVQFTVLRYLTTAIILGFTALGLGAVVPAYAADPSGLWRSESGLSRYRVRHCGQGICVRIVWIVEGPQVRDIHNPDPALRNRRVMGIDIASNFAPDGPNRWQGSLYNFKNGKNYDGYAALMDDTKLQVAGCVFGGIICLKQTLQRLTHER